VCSVGFIELPRWNEKLNGKKYKYVYGISPKYRLFNEQKVEVYQ
jgi:hypothetical protein